MLVKNTKLNINNVVYGLDFGTTTLKISKNEMLDEHDFRVLDYLRIRYPEPLTKKMLDFNQFRDFIIRSFNRIDGEVDDTKIVERKVLVTLPMSHYSSKIIPVSMPINSNMVDHDHKVELINKARDRYKSGVILHTVPLVYRIDGKEVKDPVGKSGTELSMDLFVVSYNEFIYEQFKSIIASLNMQLGKFIAPPLSFINLFLNTASMKDKGEDIFCIDMGGEVTYAYYIKSGALQDFISIPHGGEIITRDLAYVFKTKMSDAERLKITYSSLQTDVAKENVVYKEMNYSRKMINQVVEARYDEIIGMIEAEIDVEANIDNCPKLLLLGKGHPSGADKYLSSRWQMDKYDVSSISSHPEHIYAVGNVHYSQNNEIFLYDTSSGKRSLFSKVFKVVEDLF